MSNNEFNHRVVAEDAGASRSTLPEPMTYTAREDRAKAFLSRQQQRQVQSITQSIDRMGLSNEQSTAQTHAQGVQAYDTTNPSFRPAVNNFAGKGQRLSTHHVQQQQQQQQQTAAFASPANPGPSTTFTGENTHSSAASQPQDDSLAAYSNNEH